MDPSHEEWHLPLHMGWIAYRLQLWPGVRYGIDTMTNDVEEAEEALGKMDYLMLKFWALQALLRRGEVESIRHLAALAYSLYPPKG